MLVRYTTGPLLQTNQIVGVRASLVNERGLLPYADDPPSSTIVWPVT